MRKIIIGCVAAVVLASGIGALYAFVSNPWTEKDKPILFVPKTVDGRIDFWQVLGQGVHMAAKEFGEQVQTVGTVAESDISGQIALLEKAIEERPKAIVMAASDYNQLVPVARKIRSAGIPLITVDSGLNGGISASFIATDNYKAGKQAGQSMAQGLDESARIAIVSFVKGSTPAMERERGVRDQLKESGMESVLEETYYSDASESKAYEIVKQLLRDKPDLDGIVCLNEPTTVGAAKAVKELLAGERPKMVGFDSSTDEIAFLEEDIIQAIVVQKPFNMGYLAVRVAVDVTKGREVETLIDTGSEVITKMNMYTKENQKLLFPFEGQ
ncbi:substrate-binding domain-containing protein [Cohnella luojiensis]|uniref:LacI family transcriptional regulator n=1 Tax=Cohnella luojiensis TaxID=652876 RepID=A0A4Y8M6B9_9BACL|nr:substrate-binding domain-containing protein [Cohnella luojiensis]TFE30648.1 LacI family transcriptional regulator [Cohnella luojiensis]